MTSEQELRLKNRVNLCHQQITDFEKKLKMVAHNLKFWKTSLQEANLELHERQLTLNLRCTTCGD